MTDFANFILESSGLSREKSEETINRWYEESKKSNEKGEED